MRGQINIVDVSVSFLVMITMLFLSMNYLNVSITSLEGHFVDVEKQKEAILLSDKLLNDPSLLGAYRGNGVKPHSIELEKLKTLPEDICIKITSIYGDVLFEKKCEERKTRFRRIVFAYNGEERLEVIMDVWV